MTGEKELLMRPMQVENTCVTNEFDIIAPTRILKNHPIENVIGELTKGRKTRDKLGLKPTSRAWYERLTIFLI